MAQNNFYNIDLEKEYRDLLAAFSPLVCNLKDANVAANFLVWLTKFGEATENERDLRNRLLAHLLENVRQQKFEYPFDQDPAKFSLQEAANAVGIDFINFPLLGQNNSAGENEIEKYRRRSKKYQKSISQYQELFRSILEPEEGLLIPDSGRTHVNTEKASFKAVACDCVSKTVPKKGKPTECPCEAQTGNRKNIQSKPQISDNLNLRVRELEDKAADMEVKLHNAESMKLKAGEIKKKYKERFQRIIEEKDQTINQLREDIAQSIPLNNSIKMEDSYLQKMQELERKYKKLIDDLMAKHSQERAKDRQTIFELTSFMKLP